MQKQNKVQKSIRLTQSTYYQLQEIKREDENETALIERALIAGVEAIKNGGEEQPPAFVLEALQDKVRMLQSHNEQLQRELDHKNEQLSDSLAIAKAAQLLYGQENNKLLVMPEDEIQEKPEVKETEQAPQEQKGFWSRLFS